MKKFFREGYKNQERKEMICDVVAVMFGKGDEEIISQLKKKINKAIIYEFIDSSKNKLLEKKTDG